MGRIPSLKSSITRQAKPRNINDKQKLKAGLMFNGLSIGFGSAVFALSLAYVFGVIGTQEREFDYITCGNLTIGASGEYPVFSFAWQCNYINLELWAGSLIAIAGLIQIVFCLLALSTGMVGWRVWMYPHILVAVLLFISGILLFYVFSSTASKSDYFFVNETTGFWNRTTPHMGITNAEPIVVKFLVLLLCTWVCLDFVTCVFTAFIAIGKRKAHVIIAQLAPEGREDEESAHVKGVSSNKSSASAESKQAPASGDEEATVGVVYKAKKPKQSGHEYEDAVAGRMQIPGKHPAPAPGGRNSGLKKTNRTASGTKLKTSTNTKEKDKDSTSIATKKSLTSSKTKKNPAKQLSVF